MYRGGERLCCLAGIFGQCIGHYWELGYRGKMWKRVPIPSSLYLLFLLGEQRCPARSRDGQWRCHQECRGLEEGSLRDLHNFASQGHGRTVMVCRRAVSSSALPKAALAIPRQPAPAWERATRDERSHRARKGKGFFNPHPSAGRCGCTHIVCIQVHVHRLIPCSLRDTHNFNFLDLPGAFPNQLQLWLTRAALCCAQRWAAWGRRDPPPRERHLHPFVCDQGCPSSLQTNSAPPPPYPLDSISARLWLRSGVNSRTGQRFGPVPAGSGGNKRRDHRGSPVLSTERSVLPQPNSWSEPLCIY